MTGIGAEELHEWFDINFYPNFCKFPVITLTSTVSDEQLDAYRATVPYLIKQGNPNSSWTICTGSQGDIGIRAGPAMTQGALFSMAMAACRETMGTNVRFNEVYLNARVEVDSMAAQTGMIKASDFAELYQRLLARPDIIGCRVTVNGPEDFKDLRFETKVKAV
jgi:hypothetical protein